MTTLASILGDKVSVLVDEASADETAAVQHMRHGQWKEAARLLGRAQQQLAEAERELWALVNSIREGGQR